MNRPPLLCGLKKAIPPCPKGRGFSCEALMNFTRVIGKIDDKLVRKAEDKLSQVFLELALRYDYPSSASGLGGDPLLFSLIYPVEHVCTLNCPTVCTDGIRFFWNPNFVIKQSRIGLRIICSHEAWHAIYLHPQRRGSRLPKLWNIAVDYIVNGNCMEDLKARKQNPIEVFLKHMGRYATIKQYSEMLKNPWGKVKGFEDCDPTISEGKEVNLPGPNEDRELTIDEMKELERREKSVKFYFADPDLEDDMKSPEKIYDLLYKLLPKCPVCGRIGYYKKPNNKKDNNKSKQDSDEGKDNSKGNKKGKKSKSKDNDSEDKNHDHENEEQCECDPQCGCSDKNNDQSGKGKNNTCPECGGYDIFEIGGSTLDEHISTEESEEKLAKRISEAIETAKTMSAGHIPSGLEDELGKLTAPKITWQDIIRTRIQKTRMGRGKNDWTRFKTRPMFSGLLVPKKKEYFSTFGCVLDTSGSMSKDDMAFGVSQLIGLDSASEGIITPNDAQPYWDDSIRIQKCDIENLCKIKPTGRGGTYLSTYINEYEKHIGKVDFMIIITDSYLIDNDIAEMKDPGIPVYWLITSHSESFKAPFGKVYNLYN